MAKIGDEIRDFVKRSYEDEYMDPKELLALADRIDRELVELPKDADGEYIHIGDVMEWDNGTFTVHELKVTEDGWTTWDEQHGYTVHTDETHHHEPTVEDVLREFAYGLGVPVADSYVAAAATKLRLVGENA